MFNRQQGPPPNNPETGVLQGQVPPIPPLKTYRVTRYNPDVAIHNEEGVRTNPLQMLDILAHESEVHVNYNFVRFVEYFHLVAPDGSVIGGDRRIVRAFFGVLDYEELLPEPIEQQMSLIFPADAR